MAKMSIEWLLAVAMIFMFENMVSKGALQDPFENIHVVKDLKDFKKLLRTKTNVLTMYAKSQEGEVFKRWLTICNNAGKKLYGRGTIAFVDCRSDEGKQICKKMKVAPEPVAVKHYHNGEFHKDYDRLESETSVERFMLDPTGDAPWEEDSFAGDIVHISSDQEFLLQIKKQAETKKSLPILAMFYAPWCGHCKRMKPDFALAASDLKGHSVLMAVDATRPENNKVAKLMNITSYPTILYFESGNFKFAYSGESNRNGIVEWMKNPTPAKEKEREVPWSEEPSEIAHLTDADFDAFISSHASVLVMFYAPWCGHCKRMKPDYAVAAQQLKEKEISGVLAAVDSTEAQALGTKFGIKGFPTRKYFKDGEFAFDVNFRTSTEIMAFMTDPKEPPPPPPPEKDWSEVESSVLHLTGENYKTELKKRKHALVMFYAPSDVTGEIVTHMQFSFAKRDGYNLLVRTTVSERPGPVIHIAIYKGNGVHLGCGHCKAAKPEFTEAADSYQDEAKVAFAAVDCTQPDNKALCSDNGVTGYPTIKYFNYLKTEAPYNGGRTKAEFVSFIDQKLGPREAPPEVVPDLNAQDDPWGGKVLHLTSNTFEEALKASKFALVMYYAPWCGHCKNAKPEFAEASKKLAEEVPGAILGAVDCTQFSAELCSDVQGYPTFKLFKSDQFVKEYNGGRRKESFLSGLKELAGPSVKEEL